MKDTAEQVDGLKQLLVVKMQDVEVEKKNTDILIENVGKESEIAQVEKDKAKIQEDETNEATRMANEEKAKAEAELAEAVPAMKAAEEAVNCLTKGSIQELKALTNPPAACVEVTKCVLILKGEKRNFGW